MPTLLIHHKILKWLIIYSTLKSHHLNWEHIVSNNKIELIVMEINRIYEFVRIVKYQEL